MSQIFWQAKIWGLLHDPVLKALHNNTGRGGNSFWQDLAVMKSWVENGWNPETSGRGFFEHIHLADYIASASDRGAVGIATKAVNYDNKDGLEIKHLLSGKPIQFKLAEDQHQRLSRSNRGDFLQQLETSLLPASIKNESTDIQQVFWWLWRCLPEATCQAFGNDASLLLMPAETRFPDSSIWNHASLTAAMAGALAGYELTEADLETGKPIKKSHPYLAVFSFTPVQELIKASRKMRDFASGSWILHYLSAKVSWTIACKYGPDCLIYPNLFKQPLIDHWLLQKYPHFSNWVNQPGEQLLTAGFPNVLVMVLPEDKVEAAMQLAEQTLKEAWLHLAHLSFAELQEKGWMSQSPKDLLPLNETDKTWQGWLKSQWQTYWSAIAIGKKGHPFKNSAIEENRAEELEPWVTELNHTYRVMGEGKLFRDKEENFLRQAYAYRLETQGRRFSVNVGSWWPHIFDTARAGLEGVKNSRTWEMPTAFGVRSTISGLGPVVHPGGDQVPEGTVKKLWKQRMGRFDGREQLNATEVVKRSLPKILPQLLELEGLDLATYPDLTAGVAGYLKTQKPKHERNFRAACQAIKKIFPVEVSSKWGIPLIDQEASFQDCHSRYLSPGWLLEDYDLNA